MGGASSFYAMLSICGFLSAAWCASKVSRLAGVSSIVLEIATGVLLGPGVLKLIAPEYAQCEHARHSHCEVPPNIEDMVRSDQHLGEHLGKLVHSGWCDLDDYSHGVVGAKHNSSHKSGGAQDPTSRAGVDNGARRLSGGGSFDSYRECLEKSCEAEVSHDCSLTPGVFTLIGHAGVALMIFESGMHFDFEKAKVVGLPACAVAVLGTILPLVFGSALMVIFGKPFMPHGISAGTALAPTSVGIALRLLGEAGVLQQNFGQAIITAAFVDDILSLVLFNVLFSLKGDFDVVATVVKPVFGIVLMLIAMAAAMKVWPGVIEHKILARMPAEREPDAKGIARMRLTRDEALFLLQMVFLVVYALITNFLGTHLWGCFIAGMSFACLAPAGHAHHVWVKQTKRMTTWMIRIFFACTVAFSIPVAKLLSFPAFLKGSAMGLVACIGTKVVCAPFMGPARWVIGWAMVGRAEFAYLIAQMALAGNMLDQESFSVVIWALLYATVIAPFAFRVLLDRYIQRMGLEVRNGGDQHGREAKLEEAVFACSDAHTEKRSEDKLAYAGAPAPDVSLDEVDVQGMSDQEGGTGKACGADGSHSEGEADDRNRQCSDDRVGGRSAAANAGGRSGRGLVCCLFFKHVVYQ